MRLKSLLLPLAGLLAITLVAVLACLGIRPSAVAALNVNADQIDAVSDHVVEVANVAFGDGLAHESIATADTPQLYLLAAQEWAVISNLEFLCRRLFSGRGSARLSH